MNKHHPRKRFGQHFLHDADVINRIVSAVNPRSDEMFVEIGPGLGALTTQILPKVHEMDAIELDRDIIPLLEKKCRALGQLKIHSEDVLQFNFKNLAQQGQKLHVFGNLPYNISTPLLFYLIEQSSVIADMVFMLQKEVVDRITASPGNKEYGRLSIMVQYYCRAELLFVVQKEAFDPPPKVDSAVLRIVPYTILPFHCNDLSIFKIIVREAFNHRRKTLRNALKEFLNETQWESVGIDPARRPEELSVEDYVNISNHLASSPAM